MFTRSIFVALAACLISISVPARADYTFTTLDVPSASSGSTYAYGINATGAVVGFYQDTSDHGFVYSNGTYTTLNDPSGTYGTYAQGINASGAVVGYYQDASGYHGFLYSNGIYTTLNDSSATGFEGTIPQGINDSGDVTGYYADASGNHGFIATPNVVPEPASLAMLGMGVLMVGGYGARRSLRSRRTVA
jgi:probable HAF family extracellular repeat protein